jgi:hypothetical protein
LVAIKPEMTPEQESELEALASEEELEKVTEAILDKTFPRTRWGTRAGTLIVAKNGAEYVLYPDGSLRRKDKLEQKIAAMAASR